VVGLAAGRLAEAAALLAATEATALLATETATLLAAATAAEAAPAAATALRARDLGRGVAEGRSDLVDLHLDDGALLALTGLEGPLDEAPLDDDAVALGERLGDVLRRLPPHRAAHEQRLAVLPLVGLPVERPRRRGHGEARDGRTGGGEAQLGVSREVAHHGDDGLACHVGLL